MRINFKTSLVYKTMNITERFLNYTKFDTQSNEDSTSVPSTEKQLVFANYLKEELVREGLTDVEMDDKGYVYATLKGNTKKTVPTIGFISHYDTSPDCSGKDVKARIVENFQALCTEMEGAGIAHAAYLNKVSYVIIRAISDKADNSATMDYPEFEKQAIAHSVALVKELLPMI